jgi:hypothetical protein
MHQQLCFSTTSTRSSPGSKSVSQQVQWELWRIDDHGTEFLIAKFNNEEEAKAREKELTDRGHKQVYFLRQSTELGSKVKP